MGIKFDSSEKRDELPEFDIDTPCHECGRNDTLTEGFGLAGGGYGSYTYCCVCNVVVTKTVEDDES